MERSGGVEIESAVREAFGPEEACALGLDAADPLAPYRDRFHIPRRTDNRPVIYLAGNSLGLQPTSVRGLLEEELHAWAELGVEGHFVGVRPWYSYHELFRESAARLVGAKCGEVVMMNTLTVNLHLMIVTFYQPTATRYRILMEDAAFPSDTYAVKTQLRSHGFEPAEALVTARPRPGEHTLRTEDIEALIEREGERIALVLLGGVNYYTGQVFELSRIAAAARRQGCTVGFDLAHAVGNVPLQLHDDDVDFAVWCNYKYLNGGPGAVGGCFVHERHGTMLDLPRFGGWWGNDPATRFRMHTQPEFVPREGADGWQVSNPPIFSLTPVKASLDIFDEAGMPALRAKSQRLTGYLQYLLDELAPGRIEVITPRPASARGCQLSMFVHDRPKQLLEALHAEGVVCDFREPNVIRVAPVPLYNSFHDVWAFAQVLTRREHPARPAP
ncbi:MAG: kynureninase [Planctomycetes bacterium]|nr:kynureninase [Planctomycetota bacterium]